jgi:hypothetical protein
MRPIAARAAISAALDSCVQRRTAYACPAWSCATPSVYQRTAIPIIADRARMCAPLGWFAAKVFASVATSTSTRSDHRAPTVAVRTDGTLTWGSWPGRGVGLEDGYPERHSGTVSSRTRTASVSPVARSGVPSSSKSPTAIAKNAEGTSVPVRNHPSPDPAALKLIRSAGLKLIHPRGHSSVSPSPWPFGLLTPLPREPPWKRPGRASRFSYAS